MCFKYEEEYPGGCWDHMEWGLGERNIGDGSLINLLEDQYGVEFQSANEFLTEFFHFMEQMHERGIVKPKSEETA